MSDRINTALSHKVPLILVVDDDRMMRSLLNLALEEEGYQVVQAKNGEQGLAEYTSLQPDLILLDAVMPEMDGFTFCERIRQLDRGDLIPILMITVLDDRESIEQAFAVGATDYITKPIHWEVLSYRVGRLLTSSQRMLEIEQIQAKLQQQQAWEQTLKNTLHKFWQCDELTDILPIILGDIQQLLKVDNIIFWQAENKLLIESISASDRSTTQTKSSIDNLFSETKHILQNRQETIIAVDAFNQIELSSTVVTQLTELNIKALLIAPIIMQKQVGGLLCAYHSLNLRQWKNSEFEQFSDIAKLLSIARSSEQN